MPIEIGLWIKRTSGGDLRQRFMDHADRVALADREALTKHELHEELVQMRPLSDERVEELEATGGSKGSFRSWHGEQDLRKLRDTLKEEMDTAELAALLEMKRDPSVRWLRLEQWDRIPKPAGSIGKGLSYWRRDNVRGWRA